MIDLCRDFNKTLDLMSGNVFHMDCCCLFILYHLIKSQVFADDKFDVEMMISIINRTGIYSAG